MLDVTVVNVFVLMSGFFWSHSDNGIRIRTRTRVSLRPEAQTDTHTWLWSEVLLYDYMMSLLCTFPVHLVINAVVLFDKILWQSAHILYSVSCAVLCS